jgi:ATP-dependent Clp protease protease subunit
MDAKEFKKYALKGRKVNSVALNNYVSNVENMTRSVIEERETRFREIDVFSRLIMDRIIFLGTAIDDHISNIIVAQLLFLESTDSKKDISLYINSPGGSVYPGLGIYDTMQFVKPDVSTICSGLAASLGAVLLAGGAKGKRFALKHSKIMIHQPLGSTQGQSSDMEIAVKQMQGIKNELYTILANHTGQTVQTIGRDSDRDFWMTSLEAKEYGMIDNVLIREKNIE